MSASASKKKRKELEQLGNPAQTVEMQKEQEKKKQTRRTILIFAAVIIVAGVALGLLIHALNKPRYDVSKPLVTVGDQSITVPVYNYFYNNTVISTVNQYYQYGLTNLIAMDTPLSQQQGLGSGTMEDFFKDSTKSQLQSVLNLYSEAKANNYKLSDEELKSIDDAVADIKTDASESGYSNVNKYLKARFGEGCDLDSFEEYMTIMTTAQGYSSKLSEEFDPDDARISAEYEKDPSAYDVVTFTYATTNVETKEDKEDEAGENDSKKDPSSEPETEPSTEAVTEAPATEAGTEAPVTEAVTEAPVTEAATEAPETEAVTEAPETEAVTEAPETEAVTEAPETEAATEAPETEAATEAPETEAATEAPVTEAPETEAETESADAEKEAAKEEAKAKAEAKKEHMDEDTTTVTYSKSEANSMSADVAAWLFDDARKEGDTTVIARNADETTFYTIRFDGRDDNSYKLVKAYVITIPDDPEELKEGEVPAAEKLEKLLDGITDNMTDEEFETYVTGLGYNGTVSRLPKKGLDAAVVKALFDEAHEAGELIQLNADGNTYVIRYVGLDEETYRDAMIKQTLWNEDYEALTHKNEIVFDDAMMQYAYTDLIFYSNNNSSSNAAQTPVNEDATPEDVG